jgi:hypothetical protein
MVLIIIAEMCQINKPSLFRINIALIAEGPGVLGQISKSPAEPLPTLESTPLHLYPEKTPNSS